MNPPSDSLFSRGLGLYSIKELQVSTMLPEYGDDDMLPDVDSLSVPLIVAIIAAYYLGIAIHELGHVIAGRLAGLRVVACGIGFRRPRFHVSLLGTSFYFAASLRGGGLTIAVSDQFRPSRQSMAILGSGGLVANLLTALGTLGLWHVGIRSSFVAVLFYVSAYFALISTVPLTFRTGGSRFRTDALLIIRLWRGTWGRSDDPGQELAMVAAVRNLCQSVDAYLGSVFYTLALALHLVSVEDREGAAEMLNEHCLHDLRRGAFGHSLEKYARAAIAVFDNAPDAEMQVDAALDACREDPTGRTGALLLKAESALRGGRPAGDIAREALAAARDAGQADLEGTAQALLLRAEPPDDLLSACRNLLNVRGPTRPTPLVALTLLSWTTERLATQGKAEQARTLFQQAQSLLTQLASQIQPELTRRRFLARASAPLQTAAAAYTGTVPLFIPLESHPPRPPRFAALRDFFRQAARPLLFGAGLFLGIALTVLLFINYPPTRIADSGSSAFDEAVLPASRSEFLLARADYYDHLAQLHLADANHDMAEYHYVLALSLRRRALGPHHPAVAATLYGLGTASLAANKLEEAEYAFREAAAIYRESPNPEPPSLASALRSLADACRRLGKTQHADQYEKEAEGLEAGRAQDGRH